MKKLLSFTLALTIITSPAMAQNTDSEKVNPDTYCQSISNLAEVYMKSRQAGVPLSKVLEFATTDVGRTMALQAWESPRYSTESVAQREIDDFRDSWHLSCLKAVSDQ